MKSSAHLESQDLACDKLGGQGHTQISKANVNSAGPSSQNQTRVAMPAYILPYFDRPPQWNSNNIDIEPGVITQLATQRKIAQRQRNLHLRPRSPHCSNSRSTKPRRLELRPITHPRPFHTVSRIAAADVDLDSASSARRDCLLARTCLSKQHGLFGTRHPILLPDSI